MSRGVAINASCKTHVVLSLSRFVDNGEADQIEDEIRASATVVEGIRDLEISFTTMLTVASS